jgi:hypothetical protein
VVKVAGFSLVRPKNKSGDDKNTVETSEPENKEKELTQGYENKNQPTSNTELTNEISKEEPTVETLKEKEPENNMTAADLQTPKIDEMTVIKNKPKERVNCENCQRTFGTPLYMYDYSEGKRKLVGCCPYCDHIIGKPPNKKIKEPENVIASEIEKLTRLQEKAKKREAMTFQINSDDLEELIKNTAYVR